MTRSSRTGRQQAGEPLQRGFAGVRGAATRRLLVWAQGICVLLALLLPGCLAQQADLKRTEQNLDRKITRLTQHEKALEQKIAQSEERIARLGKEAEQLVTEARASLRQDIIDLREDSIPKIRGKLEETDHYLNRNREHLDNVQHQVENLTQLALKQQAGNEKRLAAIEETQREKFSNLTSEQKQLKKGIRQVERTLRDDMGKVVARLEALGPAIESLARKVDSRLEEQDKAIAAAAMQTQQLESHSRALSDQVTKFGEVLPEFKQALAELGDKLVKEDERVTKLSQDVFAQTKTLRTQVDADLKAAATHLSKVTKKVDSDSVVTAEHLAEVNKSVASVAQALKSMSGTVMARVGQQERRLDETTHRLAEVNKGISSVASALKTMNAAVTERIEAQERQVNGLSVALARLRETGGKPIDGRQRRGSASQPTSSSSRSGLAVVSPPAPAGAVDGKNRGTMEKQARERYERVLATFKQGDLDKAGEGFVEFLMQYPNSMRAPNAQYWLGECYYGKKQYKKAIEAYSLVEVKYPASDKLPAALLKKGYAYQALNEPQQARAMLKRVVEAYPGSPEASKASDRLNQLRALQ